MAAYKDKAKNTWYTSFYSGLTFNSRSSIMVKSRIEVKKMPMPLSQEVRENIIYHKKNGVSNKEISKWLRVTKRSVERIWKIYKEENRVSPKEHKRGRKPAFDDKMMDKITTKITEQPDITLNELKTEFNLSISISALSRKLTAKDLTFKKRRCFQKSSFVRTYNGFAANG
jgi:transposase